MTKNILNDLLNMEDIEINIYNDELGDMEDVYFHLSEDGINVDREQHLYNRYSSQPCRNIYTTQVTILEAIKEIKEICFY